MDAILLKHSPLQNPRHPAQKQFLHCGAREAWHPEFAAVERTTELRASLEPKE